ncbi:Starch-binding associating with outer membrane [Nonlabens sp. Hel1_33_55]|uniref:RagB/SusD family nutrient uptake outer membrane protein n=1 Tax=Nonlabens sp. Hel1_33_55 TaxID=1336802 RepID=UPI000875B6DF|nr:RagB/SusD family nutrient uptake outer membrane protein [Nonlabens sp. Hel1_33_55]SCY22063.1 Starch-binding associating with outer membrane [Nonlabens sp. Hel1_33_55]
MKNIKYLLVMVFTAGFFSSCEDAIDIEQVGLLEEDIAYQTAADLIDGLQGAYASLDTTPEIHFNSVFTDEIRIGYDNGGQGRALYSFQFNAASAGPSAIWTRGYRAINLSNRVIAAAEGFLAQNEDEDSDNDFSDDDVVSIGDSLAQALAIRSFVYLQMLSYYSPDLTDPSSLGVPLIDFVIEDEFNFVPPLRSTTGEIFNFIETDLLRARDLIADVQNTFFFSLDSIDAIRARAFSYAGDYDSAEPLASDLLDFYPLATQAEYRALFTDAGTAEVIFKLQRALDDPYDGQGATGSSFAGGWAGANYAFVGPGTGGSPYYEVATDLALTVQVADVRSEVIYEFFPTFPLAGRDVYTVNKYRGSSGQPLMNDLKIFRSPEMLFILAEGAAQDGDFDTVEDLLDDLRDARFDLDIPREEYTSAQEAYGAILDERRLEFAFEGYRYKDLRRLGALGNRSIDRADQDCERFNACDLPITDFRFTWPIPQAEFNANPPLRDQQNPGY